MPPTDSTAWNYDGFSVSALKFDEQPSNVCFDKMKYGSSYEPGNIHKARPLAVERRLAKDASAYTGPGGQLVVFSFGSSKRIVVLPERCCL